tara:strand:- start:4357 stop:4554 length:198 start_codon:yes stop_codon:yes gene_type:complete
MKNNYMMDVAASIESDQPFEEIPLDYMVAAFLKRLANILEERDEAAISEADCFEISNPNKGTKNV